MKAFEKIILLTSVLPYIVGIGILFSSINSANITNSILYYSLGSFIIIGLGMLAKSYSPSFCMNIYGLIDFPPMDSAFINFSLIYMLYPYIREYPDINYSSFVLLCIISAIIIGIDVYAKYKACGGYIIAGTIIGILYGLGWGEAVWRSGDKSAKNFPNRNVSNKQMCYRPSSESFKCTLYKNGTPVANQQV